MGVLDNIAALRSGYDLGQSVFGQDEASKKLALAEKSLGLETALKVKQLEDSQAYQQGQLAAEQRRTDVAEKQGVMQNALGWGQVGANRDNAQLQASVTREGQKIHNDLGVMQNALGWGQVGASRYATDVHKGLQEEQLRINDALAKGQISYQEAQAATANLQAKTHQAMVNAQVPYYGGLTDKLGREAKQAQEMDSLKGDLSALYTGDPDAIRSIPKERLQRLAPLIDMANLPDMQGHLDKISQIKPGGTPNDDQMASARALFNPWMRGRLGATDSEGHKIVTVPELTKIEPGSQPGTLRIKMRMMKERTDNELDPKTMQPKLGADGQPVSRTSQYQTEHYLTQDGIPEKDGGVPLDIPVRDLTGVFLMAKDLAGVQAAHPERLQAIKENFEDANGAADYTDLIKRKYARAAAKADVSKLADLQAKETYDLRGAFEKELDKTLDARSGFSAKAISAVASGDPESVAAVTKEEGPIDVKKIQAYQQSKAQFIDAVRPVLGGASLEQLRALTPGAILADPHFQPHLDRVMRQALPQSAPPAANAPLPTRGPPVNAPAGYYTPPGGVGLSPFSQAPAPAGGRYSPASYSPSGSTAGVLQAHLTGGKSQEHISHLRGPFADRLAAMLEDAPGDVKIYSGYRSPERQAQIFSGSDHSGHRVAHPGHSNHNHGLAADLKFASPKVKKWVHDNAARYGLTFRMPWEPWHIEPAGAGPDARNWGI